MNKQSLNQKLNLVYFQYKDFFFPFLIIAISLALFIIVVVPQIQEFFSLQNQLSESQSRLEILQKNFQQITGFDNQQVNTNFTLATTALPITKDPVRILNEISQVASQTNISLKDYSFDVGKLAAANNESATQIDLNVGGNIDNIQKFIHQLWYGFPLSEVTSVSIAGSSSARLHVTFFSAPVTNASFDEKEPLQLLTTQDKSMLDQITAWHNSALQ